ncbi:MAG TPA: DUF2189 domain-containing protein [Aromatoleum sp.]|uniref:DUF2189 domain-containing protein n=1 Tax=Aromatoleum sp. TaxID=2307007 RepID=UPI002B47F8A1|nr:DUF2189 domain-containing protein [Aromatoleum sp.]HJV25928.1 DUF2189 domain-containing protein [Aromatoleum sp.]
MLEALSCGLRTFLRVAPLCVAFSGSFAILGVGIISLLSAAGLAPMGLPLIGGFLLIAPALLAGFFGISRALRSGRKPSWRDITQGFRQSPRALWGLLVVCLFLFVIWVTDAGILYSFMLGRSYAGWKMMFPLSGELMRFHLGAAVAGSLFAVIVFCITAYAVPLLIERRANLVVAVTASVRAIFRSIAANMTWSLILGGTVIVSIIVPLLLTVTLPVMAFATESLYQQVFPDEPA